MQLRRVRLPTGRHALALLSVTETEGRLVSDWTAPRWMCHLALWRTEAILNALCRIKLKHDLGMKRNMVI